MHHSRMKRTLRVLAYALWFSFMFLAGLVLVAFVTDAVYIDLNADRAWYECDDCGAFMMTGGEPYVYTAMLLYTAAWAVLLAHRLRRRARVTDEATAEVAASGPPPM